MVLCYIGIGSNLGNRQGAIDRAVAELKNMPAITLRRASSVYETDPVGGIPQAKFLNGVLEIETSLNERELLSELKEIEGRLGRVRTLRNGPRVIDLDILYYGDKTIHERDLVIPHPRIHEREFVLKGLRELGKA